MKINNKLKSQRQLLSCAKARSQALGLKFYVFLTPVAKRIIRLPRHRSTSQEKQLLSLDQQHGVQTLSKLLVANERTLVFNAPH
jgi:hypothetical protein